MSDGPRAAPTLLVCRGITKRFGTQTALSHVDFDLAGGEIKGLVGANGAGKSTLLKVLAGTISPDEGEILLNGMPVALRSMQDANRHGIALVSQELSLFPALSVRENLTVVTRARRQSSRAAGDEAAREVLLELGLSISLDLPLERLQLADRQLIEIARALLLNPRVLILDEPTSALHSAEKTRLFEIVKRLRARGVGIIYVSHFLQEVLDVADELVVLRDGRRVPVAFPPTLDRLPQVVSAMLGESIAHSGPPHSTHTAHRKPTAPAGPRNSLSLTGIKGPVKLDVPEWTVEPGAVTGVAGLAGAGVHELFGILFGRLRATAGVGSLPSGHPLPRSMAQAVRSGVAYVPADRKRIGLMLEKSVADNLLAVRSLVQAQDKFFLNQDRLNAIAGIRCKLLGVKTDSVSRRAGTLSGGNQQKVVFAKWLEARPSLILLDDPTRGVDIGAKREIHALIRALTDDGCVVLMHSSDPDELITVCSRVHVFVDGAIQAALAGRELTEHTLVSAMNQPRVPATHSAARDCATSFIT